MSKTAVYINNTYPPYPAHSWQGICSKNLYKYFNSIDCDLHVLSIDNPHIQQLERYRAKYASAILEVPETTLRDSWYLAVLRKHARLIEFINSDYDQALFCDLDCLATSPESIFKYLNADVLYVGNTSWKLHNPDLPQTDFFQFKLETNREVDQNIAHKESYVNINTHMVYLNKSHALRFHEYLTSIHLNPFDEDSYVNLLKISKKHKRPGVPDQHTQVIMDETLLQFAVNAGVMGEISRYRKTAWMNKDFTLRQYVQRKPILVFPHKKNFSIDKFSQLGVLLWNR